MSSASRWCWLTLVTAALVAPACVHDWDSLEARGGTSGGGEGAGGQGTGGDASGGNGTGGKGSGGKGTGGEGPTVEMNCARYCTKINDCVTSEPDCQQTCEEDMADCPPGQLEIIAECLDGSIDSTAGCAGVCLSLSAFFTCVQAQASCWTPSQTSC
jgi:hypothetical protein